MRSRMLGISVIAAAWVGAVSCVDTDLVSRDLTENMNQLALTARFDTGAVRTMSDTRTRTDTSFVIRVDTVVAPRDTVIIELADIFGYDIDFVQDIRVGDRYTVIYEDLYKDGKKLRAGDILAAEFVNQGNALRAVRYTDPQGNAGYYAAGGQWLRKAFLRTPLDVFRVSSNFSRGRFHPVLNRIRAHLGADYAAGTGTPIKATGDGREGLWYAENDSYDAIVLDLLLPELDGMALLRKIRAEGRKTVLERDFEES